MHVIVVGAGIIGLSTAWTLLRRGHDITLIDPSPAQGASHAAAGMLAPAAEVVWGQSPLYPLMRASAEMWPEFAAGIVAESGSDSLTDLGYARSGTLVCAGDRADLQSLRELATAQSTAGFAVSLISGSAARTLEPSLSPGICGAVDIPGDHSVDPRRFCATLLAILDASPQVTVVTESVAGLLITNGCTTGIELAGGRVLDADHVVIAAGGAVSQIEGIPQLPLREVWGEVVRLRAPAQLSPLLRRTIRAVVNGRSVYVVPRPDGELVLGATSREDGRPGVLAGGIYSLLRDVERVVPGVLECEITDITCRARPGSPDDLPIISRLDPGCTVSTGYFRHGILLAPLGATLTADLVDPDSAPTNTTPMTAEVDADSVSHLRFLTDRTGHLQ